LDIDPDATVAATNLAAICADRGVHLDAALALVQRASATLPSAPQVKDTLGWVYDKKGLVTLAIPFLEEAVAGDPSKAVSHYHLGMAYQIGGQSAKAKLSFERALKLSPNLDEARTALSSLR
jgi:tetratricopeptide (TPR) repeat protein